MVACEWFSIPSVDVSCVKSANRVCQTYDDADVMVMMAHEIRDERGHVLLTHGWFINRERLT